MASMSHYCLRRTLVYLEGDTAKEYLGLPLDIWTTFAIHLTVIIHSAWTLDFNKTTVLIESKPLGPFPEELQYDASVALGNGYRKSKYVSERILAASGLEATSFRIGQVTGSSSNGAWSTTDWVPCHREIQHRLGKLPFRSL
ncbi:hypothetical protein B0H14DRAFT_3439711 [Mycena olivaceomarginata]|nr:hypothetical protein B0H14DRAFT_3439711 [Mycena olivaceomarginata]